MSFLFYTISYLIINDSEYHNQQYRQLTSLHEHHHHHHQQQELQVQQQLNHPQQLLQQHNHRQLASFDWKFYIKYNSDLHGAGINNEILSTDHYNQYGTLFTIYIPVYSCLRIIVITSTCMNVV